METSSTQQITTKELWDLLDTELSWSGYLWQDDQNTPFIFENKAVVFREYFTTNIPFIIEGLLVNTKETISLTIKHIDGIYYCYKSENFNALKATEIVPAVKALEGKEGKGIKTLHFIPVFKQVADTCSPDFSEYVYSHQIFKGINS
jgi:CRISPR type III-associated protein (TIGR04423 family)